MNTITAKLYKSGNSYSLRIPMGIVKYLGLQAGHDVTVGELRPAATSSPAPPSSAPTLHTTNELALPLPLESLRRELRRHGVTKAHVFGSYARGQARPDSDLDLLVELTPGTSYLDLGGLQYTLEQIAGCKVDIATRLNPHFASYAAKDMKALLS